MVTNLPYNDDHDHGGDDNGDKDYGGDDDDDESVEITLSFSTNLLLRSVL